MKPNLASFGGMFTPLVKDGDFVALKQQIGTIRMARNLGQYANTSGEISDMLDPQQVHAGEILCNIETDATNWQAATHTFLLKKLVPGTAKRKVKKAIKKTTKRGPIKVPKKSARKSVKKIAKKVPKKSVKKPVKKRAGKK